MDVLEFDGPGQGGHIFVGDLDHLGGGIDQCKDALSGREPILKLAPERDVSRDRQPPAHLVDLHPLGAGMLLSIGCGYDIILSRIWGERVSESEPSKTDVPNNNQPAEGWTMNQDLIQNGLSDDGFEWQGGITITPTGPGGGGGPAEAVLGPPNFKSIWWLDLAVRSARQVCRVAFDLGGSASGFLIGEDLLMTNHHVFGSANDAASASLQFNYQLQADRFTIGPVDVWEPDPDRFITNPDLDYAIVGVKSKDGKKVGETWGHFDLNPDVNIRVNQRANIIQHPQGRTKEVAFRDNQVKFVDETKVQYLTDTDYGTSGSPVLDDAFQVVALHNQRVPDPADPNRWYRNQGYRIKAILADVGGNMP